MQQIFVIGFHTIKEWVSSSLYEVNSSANFLKEKPRGIFLLCIVETTQTQPQNSSSFLPISFPPFLPAGMGRAVAGRLPGRFNTAQKLFQQNFTACAGSRRHVSSHLVSSLFRGGNHSRCKRGPNHSPVQGIDFEPERLRT